jgi:hypothetical protein
VDIQLLALDFDATIVDIHTGGRWKGTAEELATHVRNQILCIVEESLKRHITVSVVTFSVQTDLISQVMRLMDGIKDTSALIGVHGGDNHSSSLGKRVRAKNAV